jgi:hypothetical protein
MCLVIYLCINDTYLSLFRTFFYEKIQSFFKKKNSTMLFDTTNANHTHKLILYRTKYWGIIHISPTRPIGSLT